ncbi:hypothetical protein ICV01_07365 [Polynucleobacter sp. MWH-Spelu-300-X4]|uniref:hypothetical protein n=1 Tax=Polynucleobacter sp. MWH-Spelu-300-X4 TaxID=2689109 RepID=UPI001BFD569A|nr:hypothetical protein [Polynucleobacter sp. MWH-Spelu-300-X4]QWD79453.1 hypothetical protein ICV01_07365 [Polynucleobacter sp. MWH-Spelu-300-X4]
MRLNEFLSNDEWIRLQRIMYASVWEALNAYQKQRAAQYAPKPLATKLKPATTKKARALARKAKRPAQVAEPKPLPKPKQQPLPTAPGTPAYQPVKAPTPLPAGTKTVAARNQPKPPPQNAKLPPSMRELPSGLVAMIHAKSDPIVQRNIDKERG